MKAARRSAYVIRLHPLQVHGYSNLEYCPYSLLTARYPPLQIDFTGSAPWPSSAPPRRERGSWGCESTRRMHSKQQAVETRRSALTFRAAKVRAHNHRRPGLTTVGCQDQQRNRGQEGIRGHGLATWGCAAPATAGDHAKLQRGCRPAAPAHAPPGAEAVRLPRLFPPALSHPVVVYALRRPDMKVSLQRPVFRSWFQTSKFQMLLRR